jgi:hypothetical protein
MVPLSLYNCLLIQSLCRGPFYLEAIFWGYNGWLMSTLIPVAVPVTLPFSLPIHPSVVAQ